MLPLAGGPLLGVATIRRTTDTVLFISHTTNVVFISVRIIKEMPDSVASGTHCITLSIPGTDTVVEYATKQSNIPFYRNDKHVLDSQFLYLFRSKIHIS